MLSKKIIFLAAVMLVFSACTGPAAPTPELIVDVPDKPIVIQVGITPALTQFEADLQTCASDVSVLSEVLPWKVLQEETQDVVLVFGEGGKQVSGYPYQIGASSLVVVTNPDLPLGEIPLEQLQAIYDGAMTDWVETSPYSSYMGEIQLWGMMEDTELMQYTLDAIGLSDPKGQWTVAPTPRDIVDMVALDQNAIGIVPGFAVSNKVNVLIIEGTVFKPIPILAIWDHEPNQAEQDWLLCVQEAMK